MTAFSTAVRSRSAALALVIIPHLLLAVLLLRQTIVRDNGGVAGRVDIVFVAPIAAHTQARMPPPRDKTVSTRPVPIAVNIKPKTSAVAAIAAAPPAADPDPVENKTDSTVIDTAALIGMAGKIDREVRPPGENLLSGAEGKSLRQKMDDAFAAAHLAVPLKWYEAARVELFSAENDPRKIYQVKTAFGTYCLFYADLVKNPDASSQPKMSTCPKRF